MITSENPRYEATYSDVDDQFRIVFYACNGIKKEIPMQEEDARRLVDQLQRLLDANWVKEGHERFKEYVDYNNGYEDEEEP